MTYSPSHFFIPLSVLFFVDHLHHDPNCGGAHWRVMRMMVIVVMVVMVHMMMMQRAALLWRCHATCCAHSTSAHSANTSVAISVINEVIPDRKALRVKANCWHCERISVCRWRWLSSKLCLLATPRWKKSLHLSIGATRTSCIVTHLASSILLLTRYAWKNYFVFLLKVRERWTKSLV